MNGLARLMWLGVSLGLAFYFALTLWLGFTGLAYPYQLDYGEGIVLWFAQQLAHGQSIYKGLTGLPYASSNYPPVAMLLSAALMPFFGDGYVSGRFLNFASSLIVAGLIYRIVRTETNDRRFGALAALLFIGSPYIYHWAPLFRVDLIGLALTFGGVYIIWHAERTIGNQAGMRISPLLAGLLFLLGLYTKHSLFAGPAAAFLALWMRARTQAVAFATGLGFVGVAVYLIIDKGTGGAFTFGLIDSNATVFLPEQLFSLVSNFAITFAIVLLFALVAWIGRVRARQIGVLEWYVVTAFATLIMAGRTGAWENYFFEALAITVVFAGISMSHLSSVSLQLSGDSSAPNQAGFGLTPGFHLWPGLALPALLVVQLILMWHDPRDAANLMSGDLANRQLAGLLARTEGTIISEDMGALVTSGKGVAYYTFQYSSLARSGKWDQSWELDGLRRGMFPLVILERGTREDVDHYRRFTREFVSSLDRYYDLKQSIGMFQVYAPAPPLHEKHTVLDAVGIVGWSMAPETLQPGTARISLVWQAERRMTNRYTAFVHLERSDGTRIAQDDHEPHGGLYPTTHWAVGEMVREVYVLNVPGNLGPGQYVIKTGWYDTGTGDRMTVPGSADDALALASFKLD